MWFKLKSWFYSLGKLKPVVGNVYYHNYSLERIVVVNIVDGIAEVYSDGLGIFYYSTRNFHKHFYQK